MNPAIYRWMSFALLALAAAAALGFALQRTESAALRREIHLLREESRALVRLKAENERLKAAQTPLTEIERLRADHAAVQRLRDEIEAMKRRTEGR